MFNPIINPFDRPTVEVPVLRDAFSDWKIGDGIFDMLEEVADLPWEGSADSVYLDLDYFGNHSGSKLVAPIVMHMIDSQSGELLDADRQTLAHIIWTKFKEPWTRLWETNVVAYNPIHNYNMTDTRSLNVGESESEAERRDSVDSTEHGRTTETIDSVYGMNNTDKNGKKANRSEYAEGGTTTQSADDSTKRDKASARQEVETTTRSGNIGVTTSQAMLESERKLWLWNYFSQVYADIDSVLALSVYDPCRL